MQDCAKKGFHFSISGSILLFAENDFDNILHMTAC